MLHGQKGEAEPMPEKRTVMEDDQKVTSVRIPTDLRKRARVFAAEHDLTLQTVATEALLEYLKKRGA
jgi:hypothetical protein